MRSIPWADGSRELLQHAVDHLRLQGDFDRRIAMICIDNSVELMVRTYLSLPTRARGSPGPSRRELEEARESYASLLDLLEKHAGDKLSGVALDEMEWFHRIRNELYHSGQGVTVELNKVEAYLGMASALFQNLFGSVLELPTIDKVEESLGRFFRTWGLIEAQFYRIRPEKPSDMFAYDWNREVLSRISNRAADLWSELYLQRNFLMHAWTDEDALRLPDLIKM